MDEAQDRCTRLLTTGQIARQLNESRDRIANVIRQHKLRESGRAGISRVFTEDDVEFIARQLRRMQ